MIERESFEERDQQVKDDLFEKALKAKDHAALATECELRLRELSYGASLAFRIDRNRRCCWRKSAWENDKKLPPFKSWAKEAATALIADYKKWTSNEKR
ncbi:MAG: hypothetical protein ACFFFC_00530 [Candidatus Thorarchaeota archaeon]